MNNNFNKYLKFSSLSLIIKKVGDKIDLINNDNIYKNIDGCIREFNIDFILDQQKDFYFIDIEYLIEKNNNNFLTLGSKVLENNIIKIKKFNNLYKSKIIIIGCKPLQKLYYTADFIVEYIDSKPKIIKNRYFSIYE